MAGELHLLCCKNNKRINSTARMPNNDYDWHPVYLKGNTSILNPVFIFERPVSNTMAEFNYCYCNEFNRYYWIDDIILQSGRGGGSSYFYELHCHVDVLASWREQILVTPCFIKYIGLKEFADFRVDDDRLVPEIPLIAKETQLISENENPYLANPKESGTSTGVFVCRLNLTGRGATYNMIYVFGDTWFSDFLTGIVTQTKLDEVDDVDKFVKWCCACLGGMPNDNGGVLQGCKYIPIPFDWYDNSGAVSGVTVADLGGNPVTIKNHDNMSIPAYTFLAPNDWHKYIHTYDIAIDPNDIAIDADNPVYFLRSKKYLTLYLKTPNGFVDMSSDSLVLDDENALKLQIRYVFEYVNGDWAIEVYNRGTMEYLGGAGGNVSLDIGQITGFGGTQSNMIGGVASLGSMLIKGAALASSASSAAKISAAEGLNIHPDRKKDYIGQLKSEEMWTQAGASTSSGIFGSFGNMGRAPSAGGQAGTGTGLMQYYLNSINLEPNSSEQYESSPLNLATCLAIPMVPRVCVDWETYEKYGKLHGYPCSQMFDDLSAIDAATDDFCYIECSKFDLAASNDSRSTSILPDEITQINEFMNTGIYWEQSTYSPDEGEG